MSPKLKTVDKNDKPSEFFIFRLRCNGPGIRARCHISLRRKPLTWADWHSWDHTRKITVRSRVLDSTTGTPQKFLNALTGNIPEAPRVLSFRYNELHST